VFTSLLNEPVFAVDKAIGFLGNTRVGIRVQLIAVGSSYEPLGKQITDKAGSGH